MRNISVNTSALLKRDFEQVYGLEAQVLIEGATVLVTGAGGSIGSEIVRQLISLGGNVICVDNNEYALYQLERELAGAAMLVDDRFVLADAQDRVALDEVFAKHRPSLVFHAAAYKHLPILERTPAAAVLNNTFGTHNVAEACVRHGVRRFVNVSTDKAANPTSVLGMSKRLAEMVAKKYASDAMLVASVRFGNVFNSRGSFVETLQWQISNGRPVTVTDEAMTRFFMTIPQAAGLVIEAATMANGGDTYVLDMGESYNIVELVCRYAALAGVGQPEIIYTGARQGEKLDEELFDSGEVRSDTRHPAISTVHVSGDVSLDAIEELYELARRGMNPNELRRELGSLSVSTVEV